MDLIEDVVGDELAHFDGAEDCDTERVTLGEGEFDREMIGDADCREDGENCDTLAPPLAECEPNGDIDEDGLAVSDRVHNASVEDASALIDALGDTRGDEVADAHALTPDDAVKDTVAETLGELLEDGDGDCESDGLEELDSAPDTLAVTEAHEDARKLPESLVEVDGEVVGVCEELAVAASDSEFTALKLRASTLGVRAAEPVAVTFTVIEPVRDPDEVTQATPLVVRTGDVVADALGTSPVALSPAEAVCAREADPTAEDVLDTETESEAVAATDADSVVVCERLCASLAVVFAVADTLPLDDGLGDCDAVAFADALCEAHAEAERDGV